MRKGDHDRFRPWNKENMFCKNCGTQFGDGEKFCPNCGTAVSAEEVNNTPAEQNYGTPSPAAPSFEAPASSGSKIVPIVIAAVVAVLAIVVLCVFFGNKQKKVIKKYFKALQKPDTAAMVECVAPNKDEFGDSLEKTYDVDLEEYCDVMDSAAKALYDGFKDEGKFKFSYEIKDIEKIGKLDKLKKDYHDIKDMDDFKDEFEDSFDNLYDIDVDDIKTAYIAKIKWSFTIDGKKVGSDTFLCAVYKYKGKYYLTPDVIDVDSIAYAAMTKDDDYEDAIEDYLDELKDEDLQYSSSCYSYY